METDSKYGKWWVLPVYVACMPNITINVESISMNPVGKPQKTLFS